MSTLIIAALALGLVLALWRLRQNRLLLDRFDRAIRERTPLHDDRGSSPASSAAILGRKGGSTTARRHGPEHYRQMAAQRKTHGGGRPRKQAK